MENLLQDVRYALRFLRRSPGFALVAVTSLAVGIGVNAALFAVVDALLLRPLPVARPEALVDIFTSGSGGETYQTSSYPDYLDFRAESDVFEDVAGHTLMFAAQNLEDRSRLVLGEVVTGNYFRVLGIEAARGRTLLPEDDRPGAERVVMVSHRYWQRELGGDPSVVGRTLRLRGQAYAIVGVAPPGLSGLLPMLAAEIWLPTAQAEEVEPAGIQDVVPSPVGNTRLERRGTRWLFLKGRLKPGVDDRAGAGPPRGGDGAPSPRAPADEPGAKGHPGAHPGPAGPSRRPTPSCFPWRGPRWGSSAWCSSSPARTWPRCCSRVPLRAVARSASAWRWGPAAGGWCASSWRRASSSRSWAAWPAPPWPGPPRGS